MDATRARWVWAVLIAISAGCAMDYQVPAARQELQAPPEPQEPPQVVDTPTIRETKEADDAEVKSTVLGWIERIDQAERSPRNPVRPAADVNVVHREEPPAPTSEPAPPSSASAPDGEPESQPSRPPEASPPSRQPATEPPRIKAVSVRAAEASEPPPSPSSVREAVAPRVNAAAEAANAPASLRELIERLPPASEGSFRAQLDRRMLWVVAGDYERARSPLELVTAEQQELAARFIEAWIVIRNWHLGDQATAAAAATRELDALQVALRRVSDLSVPVVRMCRSVRGFGQYDAIEPPRFLAGVVNEFVLYCELRDFVSERGDDGLYTTKFDLTTTILDRSGQTVLEIKDTDIVDRCANRRQDCFIPRLVRLPASLSPGSYVVKATVIDKLGQKVAENRAAFELAAAP